MKINPLVVVYAGQCNELTAHMRLQHIFDYSHRILNEVFGTRHLLKLVWDNHCCNVVSLLRLNKVLLYVLTVSNFELKISRSPSPL